MPKPNKAFFNQFLDVDSIDIDLGRDMSGIVKLTKEADELQKKASQLREASEPISNVKEIEKFEEQAAEIYEKVQQLVTNALQETSDLANWTKAIWGKVDESMGVKECRNLSDMLPSDSVVVSWMKEIGGFDGSPVLYHATSKGQFEGTRMVYIKCEKLPNSKSRPIFTESGPVTLFAGERFLLIL